MTKEKKISKLQDKINYPIWPTQRKQTGKEQNFRDPWSEVAQTITKDLAFDGVGVPQDEKEQGAEKQSTKLWLKVSQIWQKTWTDSRN